MTFADIVFLVVIAVLVVLAVRFLLRERKKCGCAGCSGRCDRNSCDKKDKIN